MYVPKETPRLAKSRIYRVITGIAIIALVLGIGAIIFILDGNVLGEATEFATNMLLLVLFIICFAAIAAQVVSLAKRLRKLKYSGNMVYYFSKVARIRDDIVTVALSGIFVIVLCAILSEYAQWLSYVSYTILALVLLYEIVMIIRSIRINNSVDKESDTKVLEEATDLTPDEITEMINTTIPAIRTVLIGDKETIASGHLYEAVVKSAKSVKSGTSVMLKLNYRGMRVYHRIIVTEGNVPKIGATVLINISRWVAGRGIKRNNYEDECIVDIAALHEVDFDWDKLQENFE